MSNRFYSSCESKTNLETERWKWNCRYRRTFFILISFVLLFDSAPSPEKWPRVVGSFFHPISTSQKRISLCARQILFDNLNNKWIHLHAHWHETLIAHSFHGCSLQLVFTLFSFVDFQLHSTYVKKNSNPNEFLISFLFFFQVGKCWSEKYEWFVWWCRKSCDTCKRHKEQRTTYIAELIYSASIPDIFRTGKKSNFRLLVFDIFFRNCQIPTTWITWHFQWIRKLFTHLHVEFISSDIRKITADVWNFLFDTIQLDQENVKK